MNPKHSLAQPLLAYHPALNNKAKERVLWNHKSLSSFSAENEQTENSLGLFPTVYPHQSIFPSPLFLSKSYNALDEILVRL